MNEIKHLELKDGDKVFVVHRADENTCDTFDRLEEYRKIANESENKKSFNDIYEQQNVYVDRHLVKAIEKIIKVKGRKKKDIYNEALRMYLDIMYDQKIKLMGDKT